MRTALRSERQRQVLRLAAIVALASVVYGAGIVFDFEYPHWQAIRRAKVSGTVQGAQLGDALDAAYPNEPAHWHMCSYCRGWAASMGAYYHVEVQIGSPNSKRLHFAVDPERGLAVPMSGFTKLSVPALWPRGDEAAGWGASVGDDALMLPASWTGSATR